jgi:RimJ/RimL family protein N-acetyltransferase
LLGEAEAPERGLRPLDDGLLEDPAVLRWLRELAARLPSWLMVDGDEVVGACGYKTAPDADGWVEIGYGVAETRRGRGHATRAVAEMIALAAADPHIRALTAQTALANAASQGVLARNGFTQVGESVDPEDGPMMVWRLALRAP